jgi:hypothetical protein
LVLDVPPLRALALCNPEINLFLVLRSSSVKNIETLICDTVEDFVFAEGANELLMRRVCDLFAMLDFEKYRGEFIKKADRKSDWVNEFAEGDFKTYVKENGLSLIELLILKATTTAPIEGCSHTFIYLEPLQQLLEKINLSSFQLQFIEPTLRLVEKHMQRTFDYFKQFDLADRAELLKFDKVFFKLQVLYAKATAPRTTSNAANTLSEATSKEPLVPQFKRIAEETTKKGDSSEPDNAKRSKLLRLPLGSGEG